MRLKLDIEFFLNVHIKRIMEDKVNSRFTNKFPYVSSYDKTYENEPKKPFKSTKTPFLEDNQERSSETSAQNPRNDICVNVIFDPLNVIPEGSVEEVAHNLLRTIFGKIDLNYSKQKDLSPSRSSKIPVKVPFETPHIRDAKGRVQDPFTNSLKKQTSCVDEKENVVGSKKTSKNDLGDFLQRNEKNDEARKKKRNELKKQEEERIESTLIKTKRLSQKEIDTISMRLAAPTRKVVYSEQVREQSDHYHIADDNGAVYDRSHEKSTQKKLKIKGNESVAPVSRMGTENTGVFDRLFTQSTQKKEMTSKTLERTSTTDKVQTENSTVFDRLYAHSTQKGVPVEVGGESIRMSDKFQTENPCVFDRSQAQSTQRKALVEDKVEQAPTTGKVQTEDQRVFDCSHTQPRQRGASAEGEVEQTLTDGEVKAENPGIFDHLCAQSTDGKKSVEDEVDQALAFDNANRTSSTIYNRLYSRSAQRMVTIEGEVEPIRMSDKVQTENPGVFDRSHAQPTQRKALVEDEVEQAPTTDKVQTEDHRVFYRSHTQSRRRRASAVDEIRQIPTNNEVKTENPGIFDDLYDRSTQGRVPVEHELERVPSIDDANMCNSAVLDRLYSRPAQRKAPVEDGTEPTDMFDKVQTENPGIFDRLDDQSAHRRVLAEDEIVQESTTDKVQTENSAVFERLYAQSTQKEVPVEDESEPAHISDKTNTSNSGVFDRLYAQSTQRRALVEGEVEQAPTIDKVQTENPEVFSRLYTQSTQKRELLLAEECEEIELGKPRVFISEKSNSIVTKSFAKRVNDAFGDSSNKTLDEVVEILMDLNIIEKNDPFSEEILDGILEKSKNDDDKTYDSDKVKNVLTEYITQNSQTKIGKLISLRFSAARLGREKVIRTNEGDDPEECERKPGNKLHKETLSRLMTFRSHIPEQNVEPKKKQTHFISEQSKRLLEGSKLSKNIANSTVGDRDIARISRREEMLNKMRKEKERKEMEEKKKRPQNLGLLPSFYAEIPEDKKKRSVVHEKVEEPSFKPKINSYEEFEKRKEKMRRSDFVPKGWENAIERIKMGHLERNLIATETDFRTPSDPNKKEKERQLMQWRSRRAHGAISARTDGQSKHNRAKDDSGRMTKRTAMDTEDPGNEGVVHMGSTDVIDRVLGI